MSFLSAKVAHHRARQLVVASALLMAALVLYQGSAERIRSFQGYYLASLRYEALASVGLRFDPESVPGSAAAGDRLVPVLAFHGVTQNGNGLDVSATEFADEMFALARAGYHTLTLAQYQSLRRGDSPLLPDKPFLLTFDDARKDSYYPVDPVLHYLDFHAVMFAIVGEGAASAPNYYLSDRELQTMSASGRWDVEAHALGGHVARPIDATGDLGDALVNKLWLSPQARLETDEEFAARVGAELSGVKAAVERITGVTPTAYSFPFGDFGQLSNYPAAAVVVPTLAATWFETTFRQTRPGELSISGAAAAASEPARRIEVMADWGPERLLAAVGHGERKELPFGSAEGYGAGWTVAAGEAALSLTPATGRTGALALLDGGQGFTDVDMSVAAAQASADAVSVLVRYHEDGSGVECAFTPTETRLQLRVGAARMVLADVRSNGEGPLTQVGVRVVGTSVSCTRNGVLALPATAVAGMPANGTVAVAAWSQTPDAAVLRVDRVDIVEPAH